MKSLCITGAPVTRVADIAEILTPAGLQPAKATRHGTSIDMVDWHERVVPLLRAGQPMGRLWEKAAEELLLANLSDQAWGWHSHLSLWALEFWAELEPNIYFLLVAETPEAYLAKAWLAEGEVADTETLLEQWREYHARMLEFYLAHPERCLLVDARQALTASDQLVELVSQQWQLLEMPVSDRERAAATEPSLPMRLAMQLAEPVCHQYADELEALRHELEAATYPLDSADGIATVDTVPPIEALQQVQQFTEKAAQCDRQACELEQSRQEASRLEAVVKKQALENDTLTISSQEALNEKATLEQQVSSLQENAEQLLTDLHNVHEQLETTLARHQEEQASFLSEREALVQELNETREQAARLTEFERSHAALRDEYDSLLLCLHTTQEQLEASLTKRQIEQANFIDEKSSLIRELDQANEQASQLEQVERHRSALREECESLLTKLNETQEQLEASLAKRQAEQAEYAAEREALQEAVRDAETAAEQHSVAAQNSSDKFAAAQQKAERLKHECEELLLSLSQTQESLEKQVKRNGNQQASLALLQERLIALKYRAGPAFAADRVETSLAGPQKVTWHLVNLLVGESEHSSVVVDGSLAGGNLLLEVKQGDDDAWRLDLARPATLNTLLPAQRELAAGLPAILQAHLPNELSAPRRRKWQRALEKLGQSLQALPPQLSFDTSELHHVQVNPDYEHLWITLPQASFAGSEPRKWQFRVSCANVTPQAFGAQPKLEIPRQPAQLLEGWFQESQDSFGEKLELRFALPDAMDGGVWKRLPPHDQHLLQSLIAQLPNVLSSLEQQGRHPGRDWQDWHRLAADMRRILQAKAV